MLFPAETDHYLAGEPVDISREAFSNFIFDQTLYKDDSVFLVIINSTINKSFLVYANDIRDALEYIRDFLGIKEVLDYRIHEIKL